MKHKLMRLLRGQFPDNNETWREYMNRDLNGPMIVACCFGVAGVLLLLAEALDRGLT